MIHAFIWKAYKSQDNIYSYSLTTQNDHLLYARFLVLYFLLCKKLSSCNKNIILFYFLTEYYFIIFCDGRLYIHNLKVCL